MVYILLRMWTIFEHKKLDKQLSKAPIEIQKRYEKWKDIVELSGPSGLKLIRGFNDEALSGNWKGFRSSRLNQQYRVIYSIENGEMIVQVLEVTPHDYRRRS
ncbi:MAG: addiction module RelE/StbE family toxin [Paraglaciecola sp.]|jgi:addiction module RelE/StbE family toxin